MNLNLERLRAFLVEHGWNRRDSATTLEPFTPPPSLGLPEDYFLALPKSSDAPAAPLVLSRIGTALRDIYELSEESLQELLAERGNILAIQLQSPDYEDGTIPLIRFEAVIERLKRVLLHTAAFVVSETPTLDEIPEEARYYLSHCRFLQTEAGSYVAKVLLPSALPLTQPQLFEDSSIIGDEVSERFVDILEFVTQSVLPSSSPALSPDVFERSLDLVNIDVLRDLKELLERSGAEEVRFTFAAPALSASVSTGGMNAARIERLEQFITYARERLTSDREIEVVGRIVELRSRRPDRRRNYVGIAAIIEGKEVYLGVPMGRRDYPAAIMAHNRNRLVRVRGRAKQLKTQLRITKLLVFEELERRADEDPST